VLLLTVESVFFILTKCFYCTFVYMTFSKWSD